MHTLCNLPKFPAANQLERLNVQGYIEITVPWHLIILWYCMELYCGIEWYCRTVLGCISTIKMILGEWREITQCQICCSKLQHKELLTRLYTNSYCCWCYSEKQNSLDDINWDGGVYADGAIKWFHKGSLATSPYALSLLGRRPESPVRLSV